MDDSRMRAGRDVIAMVARGFEPVRIERQLLARAFDLVCDMEGSTQSTRGVTEQSMSERPVTHNIERRRVA